MHLCDSWVVLILAQPLTTYRIISRLRLPEVWDCAECMVYGGYCLFCMDLDKEFPRRHHRLNLSEMKQFPFFKRIIFEIKRVSALPCSMDSVLIPDLNPDFAPLDDEEC